MPRFSTCLPYRTLWTWTFCSSRGLINVCGRSCVCGTSTCPRLTVAFGSAMASRCRLTCNLAPARVSCLCLLDELHEEGFQGHSGVVQHSSDARPTYDSRAPGIEEVILASSSGSRCIVCRRCAVIQEHAFAGLLQLMLRTMAPVADTISAIEANELSAKLDEDGDTGSMIQALEKDSSSSTYNG